MEGIIWGRPTLLVITPMMMTMTTILMVSGLLLHVAVGVQRCASTPTVAMSAEFTMATISRMVLGADTRRQPPICLVVAVLRWRAAAVMSRSWIVMWRLVGGVEQCELELVGG